MEGPARRRSGVAALAGDGRGMAGVLGEGGAEEPVLVWALALATNPHSTQPGCVFVRGGPWGDVPIGERVFSNGAAEEPGVLTPADFGDPDCGLR